MIRLVTILLLLLSPGDLTDIAKINKFKKNAEVAYKAGQYDVAITNYSYLVDSMDIVEDEIFLNLGHAYYQSGDPENAQSQYKNLISSTDANIKSIAYQQLGFLSNDPKTLENALSYFKAALKADPTNEDARYNYELIKKKLRDQNQDQDNKDNKDQNEENKEDQEEKEDKEKQDGENKDQEQENKDGEGEEESEEQEGEEQESEEDGQEGEQKDQESQEEGEQSEEQKGEEGEQSDEQSEEEKQQGEQSEEGEEGEEEQQQQQEGEEGEEGDEDQEMSSQQKTSQKLEEMNISEEKAQMILEALKNSEVQYIQQNRRRPSQSKDSDKPDW